MKGGRSGALSAATRQAAYRQQNSDSELDVQSKSKGNLTLYNTPVAVWFAGTLIIVIGFYLLYSLIWGKRNGELFSGYDQGYWWQYFVAAIILFVGFLFVFAVKMEKLEFDKGSDTISMHYYNFCCRRTHFQRKLTQLFNVSIVKRGQDTVQNRTLHYKMILNFDDGTQLEIMETNSQRKIKEKYTQIKLFLGQAADLEQIYIVDESRQPR